MLKTKYQTKKKNVKDKMISIIKTMFIDWYKNYEMNHTKNLYHKRYATLKLIGEI